MMEGRSVGRVEVVFLYNVINEVISFCILAAGFNLPAIIKNKGQFVFSVPSHRSLYLNIDEMRFNPFNRETYTHHHLFLVSCEKFDQLGLIYTEEKNDGYHSQQFKSHTRVKS